MYRKLNDVLIASAENVPKVYDSGHKVGFEEGKTAERDDFWEVFQGGGAAKSYYYAFSYNRFNDETYNPRYTIKCSTANTSAQSMFYYTTLITDTKVAIDVTSTTHIGGMFYNASRLKTIRKIIIDSGAISGGGTAFTNCEALEEITFEGEIVQNINFQWSVRLYKASIESVITALSSTTSGLTVTFSKEAVNNAFGIDIDDESTYTEEWNTLRNSKSNWTFSYI